MSAAWLWSAAFVVVASMTWSMAFGILIVPATIAAFAFVGWLIGKTDPWA